MTSPAADPPSGAARGRPLLIALALCALALALRLAGLTAGLPHVHHVDETEYAMPAAELDWGRMRPDRQLSPTGLLYSIVTLRTVVGWSDGLQAALRDRAGPDDNQAYHVLLGRLVTAVCGALTVLPVFALGWMLAGRTAAVCAGLLMAVDFLHVRQSHWATPDVMMLLWVMAGVAACMRYVGDSRTRWLLLAGLCAGLAAVTKLTGIVVLLAAGLALLLAPDGCRARWRRLLDGALAVLVAAGAFVLVDPYALLDSGTFLDDTRYILGPHARNTVEGQPLGPVLLVYLKALWYGGGIAVCAMAAVGVVAAFGRHERRRERLLVLLLAAIYLGYMSTKLAVYVRYALFLVPLLLLLAGLGLDWLARRGPEGARRVLVPAAVLLLAAWPAAHSLRFDVLLSRSDTREQAIEWLEKNLGRREYVLLDSVMIWLPPTLPTPRVRELGMALRFREVMAGEQEAGRRPRYLVRETWVPHFWDTDHVRVSSPKSSQVATQVREFYPALEERFPVVASFEPAAREIPFHYEQMYGPWDHLWSLERPGPGVRIHDLSPPAAPGSPDGY